MREHMLQYRYETMDLEPEFPETEIPEAAAAPDEIAAPDAATAPEATAPEAAAPDAASVLEATAPDAATTASECMPDEELLYDLADLFKAFADTTRIRILYALMEQDRCVADIADIIGVSQSAVSHQLRTLKQARLVKFQRDGKNIIYSLSDDHVYTMLAQGMTHICE